MRTSPAFEIDLDRLWLDIVLYLDFLNLAHEEDAFWEEYVAWKKMADAKQGKPTPKIKPIKPKS
jgi:hypothetical protein